MVFSTWKGIMKRIFDGGFRSGIDHGSITGEGMASILVIEVFDGKVRVPNAHTIDNVEKAKGVYISWRLKDLAALEDEESKRLTSNPHSRWLHKKVLFMYKDKETIGTIIGERFVSLEGVEDVAIFERLGEYGIGVTITIVYEEDSTHDSTISFGHLQLVRWPIKLLQLQNGDPMAPMSTVVNGVGST
jgi:hypothetical protein